MWPPKNVWRVVVQVVTIARFRRPENPKRCNIKCYHVWRWETLESDPNQMPLEGMKCQCGALTWTPRVVRPT
ncbi:MAG: hypothetical protein Q8T13_23760 [Acidobacteriota bacterium]|nr:hypothetical protein [Acidobacteriota bacterium]